MAWSRKLTRELQPLDGEALRTLKDAGNYAAALPVQRSARPQWQHAAKLLLAAAEGTGSVKAATDQVEKALFLDMRLKLEKAPPRKSKITILK